MIKGRSFKKKKALIFFLCRTLWGSLQKKKRAQTQPPTLCQISFSQEKKRDVSPFVSSVSHNIYIVLFARRLDVAKLQSYPKLHARKPFWAIDSPQLLCPGFTLRVLKTCLETIVSMSFLKKFVAASVAVIALYAVSNLLSCVVKQGMLNYEML